MESDFQGEDIDHPKPKPESENGKRIFKDYWRQVGLILLGAIIGAVPTILNSKFQARMQLEQFLLDRQINALKDFSTALNQQGKQLLSKTQLLISRVRELQVQSQTRPLTYAEATEIEISNAELFALMAEFEASMETNRTLSYAVFGEEQGGVPAHSIDYADADAKQFQEQITNARTDKEKLKLTETELLKNEESIIGILNNGNAEMHSLAKKMRLPT